MNNKIFGKSILMVAIFAVVNLCSSTVFAQQNIAMDLKSGDTTIPLDRALVLDNGELVLDIAEKEVIELIPTTAAAGLTLVSSDPTKFEVINNNMIIGIKKTDTPVYLTGTMAGVAVNLNGRNRIKINVLTRAEVSTINTNPTFLSYKVVKDAFGKGVASAYLVVQVNIQNNNADKRYLVQDISVAFDPKQCSKMVDYFTRINTANAIYANAFNENECLNNYVKYFGYPMNISPIERDTILAAANTEQYRSKRFQLFKALRFFADVGSGFSTFKLLGRDGIASFGFLGGTLFNGLDAALPKDFDQKRANLDKAVPQENIIVSTNESNKFNIFIPIDRIFTKKYWKEYKKTVKDTKNSSLELRRYLQLFLIASSKGILIDANSKTTDSTGGGAKSVIDRLNQRP